MEGYNRTVGMQGLEAITLCERQVRFDTDGTGDGVMVTVYDPSTGLVIATQPGSTVEDAIRTLTLDVIANGW